jgi:hypothetical protein
VAVAPLSITQAPAEQAKGYASAEVLDAGELGQELVRWVQASATLLDSHGIRGGDLSRQLDEAWTERDDLLLTIELDRFRSEFDGHNGWWIPNILNWAFWMVPAWFVATEEYSLTFTANLQVHSVDSNRVLHTSQVDVAVQGTFDEFDRGWQFFGFVTPNNDAENWRMIVQALLPAAVSELGEGLVAELRGPFYERMRGKDVRGQMRKTLALVVGISHYQDAVNLPPLPFAGSDARTLSATLTATTATGLAPRQVTTLVGEDATLQSLERAVAELSARARPGDQTLVYFAGYGVRGADGVARVLLNQPDGAVEVPLPQLGELLAQIPGELLVILDCGFDGQGRSVARGAEVPAERDLDATSLAAASGGAALLAARPGDGHLAPEHLGMGLFSHHLIQGLKGPADLDNNGEITPQELLSYVTQRTVAEAAYDGESQRPILAGQAQLGLAAPTHVTDGE